MHHPPQWDGRAAVLFSLTPGTAVLLDGELLACCERMLDRARLALADHERSEQRRPTLDGVPRS